MEPFLKNSDLAKKVYESDKKQLSFAKFQNKKESIET